MSLAFAAVPLHASSAPWPNMRAGSIFSLCATGHLVGKGFPGLTIILGRVADGSAGYQLMIDRQYDAEHAESLVGGISFGKRYVGQTCQGWGKRWGQHRGAANSGSKYLFHQAIRDVGLWKHRLHQVIGFNLPFDNAMEIEEAFVAAGTLHPAGLNMIPGGFAGIRYLAAHNYSCDRKKWEHRDQVLKQFADYCERDGRPNPLVAMLWRDPNYASSVVCGNPRNLDRRQVGDIRSLEAGGWTPERIAAEMGIKADRVRRLLTGRTYAMVR